MNIRIKQLYFNISCVPLQLFNDGDDLSFELPINPELNPNYEREDNHASK